MVVILEKGANGEAIRKKECIGISIPIVHLCGEKLQLSVPSTTQ